MKLFNTEKVAYIVLDKSEGEILDKKWLTNNENYIYETPMEEDDDFVRKLLKGEDPKLSSIPIIEAVESDRSFYLIRDGETLDCFDYSIDGSTIKELIFKHIEGYNEVILPTFYPDQLLDTDIELKGRYQYSHIVSRVDRCGKWDIGFSSNIARQIMEQSDIRIGLYTPQDKTLSSGTTLEKGTYISLYNKDELIFREHFREMWVDVVIDEFMSNVETLDALYRIPIESVPVIIHDRRDKVDAMDYLCYIKISADPKIDIVCPINETIVEKIEEERDGIEINIEGSPDFYTTVVSFLIKGREVPYSIEDGKNLESLVNGQLFNVLTECIEESESKDPSLSRIFGTDEQRKKQAAIGQLDIFKREKDCERQITRDN